MHNASTHSTYSNHFNNNATMHFNSGGGGSLNKSYRSRASSTNSPSDLSFVTMMNNLTTKPGPRLRKPIGPRR